MKSLLFSFLLVTLSSISFAQAPLAFNYQGVARDANDAPMANTTIELKCSILKNSPTGTPVYSEKHSATTTSLGLFTLKIGNGTPVSGSFSTIDWANNNLFLQLEIKLNGSYQILGSSQLLSVPYALHANNGSKWLNSSLNPSGLYYPNRVVIGEDATINEGSLLVNNASSILDFNSNAIIAQFKRSYNGQTAYLGIYGYPNSSNILAHLRNSVMLYASNDAKDLILCAAPTNGKIRFITDNWTNPNAERATISKDGLKVNNGDVYLNDSTKGVIMTSPDGQCWKMTVSNSGQPVFTSIACPN